MSSFTTPLLVKVLDDGKNYEILEDFEYYRDKNKEAKISIKKGFITNFASVPRIFWSIFPPFGKYTKCAVLHDRLCEAYLNKESWDSLYAKGPLDLRDKSLVTRKEADFIFLESMKAIKIHSFTAYTLYFCVRGYAVVKYGFKA